MDSEKILFFYRDDKAKRTAIVESADEKKIVAAVPCVKTYFGKTFPISHKQIKKGIAGVYEQSEAAYLWLDDFLCEFLRMEKMELPEILYEQWLAEIPFFHTLIFADDKNARVLDYVGTKTDKLAAVGVVCYEKYLSEYEILARKLFLEEGIVLQIISYEMLDDNPRLLMSDFILKGRCAVLDFERQSSFGNKKLLKDIAYYSFWKEIRLFLDTFQKNRYNTLTK